MNTMGRIEIKVQQLYSSVDEYINQGSMGRHETFTPRYGWLKKGFDAVLKDPNIFKAVDAIERLGVGKNMVSSIRFWCQAFKLIRPNREGGYEPTKLGEKLLGESGWDRYLEDEASLWLLHWQLFLPSLEGVSWSLAFNKCNLLSFNIKELARVIKNHAQKYHRFATVSEKSFERDASCIIRMYYGSSDKDSEIDCPFTQLGLIRKADEKNYVSFNTAEKATLPPLIYAAVCFSYLANYVSSGQKTILLSRLTYDFNSPGAVFKLPESTVGNYLSRALDELNIDGVTITDSLGSQLHFTGVAEDLYWLALKKYYEEQ